MNLDRDISFGDLPHVEANCGNHVFTEVSRLERKGQRSLCDRYAAGLNVKKLQRVQVLKLTV